MKKERIYSGSIESNDTSSEAGECSNDWESSSGLAEPEDLGADNAFESDPLEVDDGYDQDLMGDEKDREMLNNMTEVEREKELFKRMERREAMQARLLIVKRLNAAHQSPKEDSEPQEKPNRPRREKISTTEESLKKIKENRKRRGSDPWSMKNDEKEDKAAIFISPNNVSDRIKSTKYSQEVRRERYKRGDFEEDSDEEFEDTFSKKSLVRISKLEEFNKLRISRHKLTLWIHQPFFEEKIPGFFVKFAGNPSNSCDRSNPNVPYYQAFEIVEVLKANKPYKMGENLTNKVLRIKRGKEERVIRMEYISNQVFTEEEFLSYCRVVEEEGGVLPSIEFVEQKVAHINHCIHFRPTEQDIDHIVAQKNQFRTTPVNYTTEKAKLRHKIGQATIDGDYILVETLQKRVNQLDSELQRHHEERAKSLEKVRLINEKNRRSNAIHLEKILEEPTSDSNEDVNNPFVRRRTNPIHMLDKRALNSALKIPTAAVNKPSAVSSGSCSATQSKPDTENTSTSAVDTKSNPINPKQSGTNDPFDISKDLENLYDFDLDMTF